MDPNASPERQPVKQDGQNPIPENEVSSSSFPSSEALDLAELLELSNYPLESSVATSIEVSLDSSLESLSSEEKPQSNDASSSKFSTKIASASAGEIVSSSSTVCVIEPPYLPAHPPRTTNQLQYIEKSVMRCLWSLPVARPFQFPVDVVTLGLTDYHSIIKEPMDLTTVKRRLAKGWYGCAAECIADFGLMMTNCLTYNGELAGVSLAAKALDEELKKRLLSLPVPEESVEFPVKTGKPSKKSDKPAGASKKKKKSSGSTSIDRVGSPTKNYISTSSSKTRNRRSVSSLASPPPAGGGVSPASYAAPLQVSGPDPLRYCRKLLDDMMGEKWRDKARYFYEPVDAVAMKLPDYHQKIRHPMDLGTIRKALDAGQYINAFEFAADVRLMFTNCYRYNDDHHEIIPIARELQRHFELSFAKFPEEGYLDAPVRIVRVNKEYGSDRDGNQAQPPVDSESTDEDEIRIKDLEKEIRAARDRLRELQEKDKSPLVAPPALPVAEETKKTGPKIFLPKRPLPVGISGAKKSKLTQQLQRKRQIGERNMAAAKEMVRRNAVKKDAPEKTGEITQQLPTETAVDEQKPADEEVPAKAPKHAETVLYESDEELLPMSYDEKRSLSLEINKLPYEKVLEVVKIVKAREPEFGDYRADEMEIDFNTMQLSTLREVERFLRSITRKRGRKPGSTSLKNNHEKIAHKKKQLEKELASMSVRMGRPSNKAKAHKTDSASLPKSGERGSGSSDSSSDLDSEDETSSDSSHN